MSDIFTFERKLKEDKARKKRSYVSFLVISVHRAAHYFENDGTILIVQGCRSNQVTLINLEEIFFKFGIIQIARDSFIPIDQGRLFNPLNYREDLNRRDFIYLFKICSQMFNESF